jgi:glycosyltransferase involved in cell wall biosynthesis
VKVRVVTEKPGWIMHRKARELERALPNLRINQEWPEADIHYYINYGYFRGRPPSGVVVGNFTHYDPAALGDRFFSVAREVDHCVAVSESTAEVLVQGGVPRSKIDVILVGADSSFRPKLRVGIVGRVYKEGRKGEHIVAALASDPLVMREIELVSTSEEWGVRAESFDDPASFYRSLDYLLVPSLIEGGPVPFMEALACGTLSIAPPIGVIAQFPHIEYPTGNVAALRHLLLRLASEHLLQKEPIVKTIRGHDWDAWAREHKLLFERLLQNMGKSRSGKAFR